MRRLLMVVSLTTLALVIMGSSSFYALANYSPSQPGEVIFPLQRFAESWRAHLFTNETDKTFYYLSLTARRIEDLTALAGTKNELAAVQALLQNLDSAIAGLSTLPDTELQSPLDQLVFLLNEADKALTKLTVTPNESPQLFLEIKANISTLKKLTNELAGKRGDSITNDELIRKLTSTGKIDVRLFTNTEKDTNIDPLMVAFPPGSAGAIHDFFPLTGGHLNLDCKTCHPSGQYSGTSNLCSSCHSAITPVNHYRAECGACHNASSWSTATFNHTVIDSTDCQRCHTSIKPANHYAGQCSACHTTSAWKPAKFNHSGFTDCQSCHTSKKPANHYTGQCSACHTTNAWRPAKFNHSGFTDCQSCHASKKPANHYPGQCSACHTTNAWKPASFNHAGLADCQSCHASVRPANHYAGQCSACHSTNAWRPASFSHAGLSDCQSCHASVRPANHYTGQCSACHNTSAWRPASFNHAGLADCQSCHAGSKPANHYAGQCSACHNTSAWRPASFSHAGLTDCQSCHTNDRPANHSSGQCSNCHSTDDWRNVQSGSHSFPINHKNSDGNCANCHPGGGSNYTCYTCHDRSKMETEHADRNINNIANSCAGCHPNGK